MTIWYHSYCVHENLQAFIGSVTIYAIFFTNPLLFLVLQLFEPGGVSKRIKPNLLEKIYQIWSHCSLVLQ